MIFRTIPSRKLLTFLAGIFCVCLTGMAQDNSMLAINREKALTKATTSSDSLRILLDVYNLSDKINRERVRGKIMSLAQKSDNEEMIGDVLKELSKATDDTGDLARLIEISESLPDSRGKETVKTALNMQQARFDANNVSDSEVKELLADNERQSIGLYNDPYSEIRNIYRAMVYLGASSQGPLYLEYIQRLGELVDALPEQDHAIKNLYYTTAALFYTRKRDYKKAIESDRKLIVELDKIKELYKAAGKENPDLDYFYYVSNRRLLRNFRGLQPEEIEEVYQICRDIAARDPKAHEEFGSGGLTNSYYYYATKQWAKAIPELKKALSQPGISDFRHQELLGMLAYSLDMTGDRNQELDVLKEYVLMMMADRENRRNETYREINLRNSVNKLLNDEKEAQAQQQEQNRVMRKTSITLLYVLAVVLIFLSQAYLRMRRKVKVLEQGNNKLRKNIEYIFDDGVPKGSMDLRNKKNRLKG